MLREIEATTKNYTIREHVGAEAVLVVDANGKVVQSASAGKIQHTLCPAGCKLFVGTDAEVTTAKLAEEAKLAPAMPAPLKERP